MFVHNAVTVRAALDLAEAGGSATVIAEEIGVSRSTVRDWLNGRLPQSLLAAPHDATPDADELDDSYPYVLGLYLGDGCISRHPRDVFRLRIFLDAKYPGIIEECVAAIQDAVPRNRVWRGAKPSNYTGRPEPTCVEVSAYARRWPALFPQHGPGRKHERRIALADWQWAAISKRPEGFLRGLIHSDGCRFMNTGTNWRSPRYSFANTSEDILRIFCRACDLLDLHYTHAPNTVYVSRKADVAKLDGFIGPKR